MKEIQRPTLGQIVLYVQPESWKIINNVNEHPAIVTRVTEGNEECGINLHVFFDVNVSGIPHPMRIALFHKSTLDVDVGYWDWIENAIIHIVI